MRAFSTASFAAIVALQLPVGLASAQCARWRTDLDLPGFDRSARAMIEHDDGSGPSLFVAGEFAYATDIATPSVARWDGERFWPVGASISGRVDALAVFDDGTGPALFAAGTTLMPAPILRWDGLAWTSVMSSASTTEVHALFVFDDGSGPALFAAGRWVASGLASNVSRWNGFAWSAVGTTGAHRATALVTHDDGSGPALHCAIVDALGTTASVRRWNGTSWVSVGGTFPSAVNALASFDDGAGPTLWAGGGFQTSLGQPYGGLERWDGTAWTTVSSPGFADVTSLRVLSFSGAPRLYVGGATLISFSVGNSVFEVQSWDGSIPQTLGLSMNGAPRAFAEFDSGGGPDLHTCGDFARLGGLAIGRIARFEGAAWTPLVAHAAPGNRVACFAGPRNRFDAEIYAGGDFLGVGDAPGQYVARWTASGWQSAPAGLDVKPRSMCWFDDGNGPVLYAGGMDPSNAYPGGIEMNVLARLIGSTWQLVPGRPDGPVNALAVFDDGSGPALFVGGGLGANLSWPNFGVLKYDGTNWIPIASAMDEPVHALHVHDDGTGPALYAGGQFTTAGGANALRMARWNGSSWAKVGSGIPGAGNSTRVTALATFDDGTGPALYAGISNSLGAPVWKWDGTSWTGLGLPTQLRSVLALAAWDDGSGSALYATGSESSGRALLSRWDGLNWSPTGSGAPFLESNTLSSLAALRVFDDGSGNGSALLVGGTFASIDGTPSGNIAVRQGCTATGVAYCFGTSASCPCANGGVGGRGCANSVNPSGGLLTLSGQPFVSADTLVLHASGMTNGAALYFQGVAQIGGGIGVPLFDGRRCVNGVTVRLGTRQSIAGTSSLPEAGGSSISARGLIPADGATRHYHVVYRDLAPSFCTPALANTTNALSVHWLP